MNLLEIDNSETDLDELASLQQTIVNKINKDCQNLQGCSHINQTSYDHSSPTKSLQKESQIANNYERR